MQKIELGKTGLMVSEVSFGGIPIQRLSDGEAVNVVRACLDLGVNFLDTATGYGPSEERIGRAIAGRRDGLILASKSPGKTADAFREHLTLSLERLAVDYIDLYQFHNVSSQDAYAQVTGPGGALEAAREARDAGRIRHIGFTSHKLDIAVKAADSGLFETIMFPFNYITCEPAEELIPLCEKNGVGFIAMKPMGGGLLDDAGLSFKYLRQFSGIVPVVGIEREAEMAEIVSVIESGENLDAAGEAEIERRRQELGKRFCRACGYCQPCSEGIQISNILRLKSALKRFPAERFYGERTQSSVAQAEGCVKCGECESRCPYELPIREMLEEHVTWYHEQMALHRSAM